MSSSWFNLGPRWHLAVAFVLTFAVASPLTSVALPHANKLRAAGHTSFALYFNVFAVVVWIMCLAIMLPRGGNSSRFGAVRAVGRLPLLARYVVAAVIAALSFWAGLLYGKFVLGIPVSG